MGDLQCPARLWVAWPHGQDDVERWARSLVEGLALHVVDLRHSAPDLMAVADAHRGEDVLVLVDRVPDVLAGLAGLGEGQLVQCEVDSSGIRPAGPSRTV